MLAVGGLSIDGFWWMAKSQPIRCGGVGRFVRDGFKSYLAAVKSRMWNCLPFCARLDVGDKFGDEMLK